MKVFRRRHPDSTRRRQSVIARLEAQLERGTKTRGSKNASVDTSYEEPLTDADKSRINRELTVLQSRI